MLVLSRQINQSIRIGDELIVTVVHISTDRVKLHGARSELRGRLTTELVAREFRRGERVRLMDDVVCEIVDIRGDKARLGIECPKNMSVHRKEVYDATRRFRGTE